MSQVKLVAVDMDGTFLDDTKKYNKPRFLEQYAEMKRRGIRFVVASGNQYYQLISFFPEIRHDIAFVAENGGYIVNEDKELLVGEFTQKDIADIIDTLQKGNYPNLQFVMNGQKSAYILPGASEAFLDKMQHYLHRLQPINSVNEINDKILKFALNLSDEYVPVLMGDINRLHAGAAATSSGHGSIDLIIPGLHKANGLALLQQRWGIKNEEVLAFGDGGNDLEMLAQSGFSFAMENAPAAVKKAARYQAGNNNQQGVLEVIQQMLQGDAPFR